MWDYAAIDAELAALWGYSDPTVEVVPVEHRCWKCDCRRIHERCVAGLCDQCCEQLREASVA